MRKGSACCGTLVRSSCVSSVSRIPNLALSRPLQSSPPTHLLAATPLLLNRCPPQPLFFPLQSSDATFSNLLKRNYHSSCSVHLKPDHLSHSSLLFNFASHSRRVTPSTDIHNYRCSCPTTGLRCNFGTNCCLLVPHLRPTQTVVGSLSLPNPTDIIFGSEGWPSFMRVFHSTPSSQIKHQKVQQEHHQPHHKHQHPLTEEEREQNEEKFGSNPKCWSCSNFLNRISLFCHSCEKVQPPSQYDYFELMGVPKQFDLDTKKLEKHFWALQRKLHPDNFHTASEREKAFSQGISSMINQAYSTLKHPQKRAKYLLKLAGIEVDETTETITDPGLLMGVMEIRMQVEEAGDEQLRALDAENKKRLADLYHRISKAFAENRFEEAKQIAFKLQYYGRIDEEIHKKKKIV